MYRQNNRVIVFFLLVFLSNVLIAPVFAAEKRAPASAKLETTAESAILMDSNGTVLYEKNSHKRLPPASVTKIMTLLLAVEAIEEGRAHTTDEITVSENSWKQGGSQIWLEPGEKMSMQELMIAIAVVSANDAAVAVMEHLFGSQEAAVGAMNKKAESLGLKDTHFNSVNGLPTPDHYMSAYDTAQIAKEVVSHPLYMELCGIKEYWLRNGKNWLVNTNKLLWWYKGADGLKTGWTEEAKYCFAGTAQRDGLRLISVVFATPEPRSHLRESMKLMDWGFANFMAVPVVQQGEVLERLKVNKGTEREVQLVAAQDLKLVIGKGQNKNLQKKVVADIQVTAPIIEGQKYGELIVLNNGKEVGKVALVAEKSIEKASFFRIIQNMFSELFAIAR